MIEPADTDPQKPASIPVATSATLAGHFGGGRRVVTVSCIIAGVIFGIWAISSLRADTYYLASVGILGSLALGTCAILALIADGKDETRLKRHARRLQRVAARNAAGVHCVECGKRMQSTASKERMCPECDPGAQVIPLATPPPVPAPVEVCGFGARRWFVVAVIALVLAPSLVIGIFAYQEAHDLSMSVSATGICADLPTMRIDVTNGRFHPVRFADLSFSLESKVLREATTMQGSEIAWATDEDELAIGDTARASFPIAVLRNTLYGTLGDLSIDVRGHVKGDLVGFQTYQYNVGQCYRPVG